MLIFVVSCGTEQNPDLNEEDVQKNERHIGKVIEKITASGYSYLQVVENKNEYWIAVPSMEIEVGETIYFSKFMVMEVTLIVLQSKKHSMRYYSLKMPENLPLPMK